MLACGSETVTPPDPPSTTPASIELSPRELSILQGQVGTVTAVVRDAAGRTVSDARVVWSSRDRGIASVSTFGQGRVTPSHSGTTWVSARVNGLADSTRVTVVSVPLMIRVSPAGILMASGDFVQLGAAVIDRAGDNLFDATGSLSLEATNVVELEGDGTVRSLGPLGSATITASSPDLPAVVVPIVVGTHPEGVIAASHPTGRWSAGVAVPNYALTASSDWVYRGPFDQFAFTDSLPFEDGWGITRSIRANASGTMVYVPGSWGLNAVDWSARTTTLIGRGYNLGASLSFCIHPNGEFGLLGTDYRWGANLFKIDLTRLAVVDTTIVRQSPSHCVTHPSGEVMYFSSPDVGWVTYLHPTQLYTIAVALFENRRPQGIALDPTTSRLFVVLEHGNAVAIIDAFDRPGLVLGAIPIPRGGFGTAISPDGQRLYVTFPGDQTTLIIDVETEQIIGEIPTGGGARDVVFSRLGHYALIGNDLRKVDFVR